MPPRYKNSNRVPPAFFCYNGLVGIFYTGKGDGGMSEVWNGKKLDKTSPGLVALGDLDETNSIIGVLRSRTGNKNNKKILISVQEDLFIVQANIYFSLKGQEA